MGKKTSSESTSSMETLTDPVAWESGDGNILNKLIKIKNHF